MGLRGADVRTGLAILVTGGVAAVFLARFAPARFILIETARPALAAIAILLACTGFGALATDASRRLFLRLSDEPDDFEALSLLDALLLGFAVLGTVAGVVAWIGIAVPVIVIVITAAGAVLGAVVMIRSGVSFARIDDAAASVAAIPVLLALVQAVTPANSPDELVYKLAVPHAYRVYGRMLELPLNSHSYLAMSDQLVSFVALVLSNGIAARLVHFAMFVAAVVAIYRLTSSAVAVAVAAWTPALLISAGWAWNDWSTLALLVIAVDRYERWVEHESPSDGAMAFAAMGAAASIKYTALPWIGVMALLLVARRLRDARFLAITALFGAFFYVRNAVWTGSPFAPLFLPNAPALSSYRTGAPFEGWLNVVRGYIVFDPRLADESLGILLPAAAIIGLFALRSRERWLRDLAIVGAVQLVVLIAIAPDPRIMVNAFLPVAAAGAVLAGDAVRRSHVALRAIAGLVMAIVLAAQLALTMYVLSSYEIVPYLTGQENAHTYLARSRAFVRPFDWLARFTPPSARILLLGENRTLYLERQCVAAGNLDGPRVAAWLSSDLPSNVRAAGITHVLLHIPWYRAGGPAPDIVEKEHVLQVSPATDATLRAFLQSHGRLVYRDQEYLIFELR